MIKIFNQHKEEKKGNRKSRQIENLNNMINLSPLITETKNALIRKTIISLD